MRVKIVEIDEERRRMSLSIKRVGEGGLPLRDAFEAAQATTTPAEDATPEDQTRTQDPPREETAAPADAPAAEEDPAPADVPAAEEPSHAAEPGPADPADPEPVAAAVAESPDDVNPAPDIGPDDQQA